MATSKGKASIKSELTSIKRTEMILKATKEVVVKFIEMGKVSPTSFDEVFQTVFASINKAMDSAGNIPPLQK